MPEEPASARTVRCRSGPPHRARPGLGSTRSLSSRDGASSSFRATPPRAPPCPGTGRMPQSDFAAGERERHGSGAARLRDLTLRAVRPATRRGLLGDRARPQTAPLAPDVVPVDGNGRPRGRVRRLSSAAGPGDRPRHARWRRVPRGGTEGPRRRRSALGWDGPLPRPRGVSAERSLEAAARGVPRAARPVVEDLLDFLRGPRRRTRGPLPSLPSRALRRRGGRPDRGLVRRGSARLPGGAAGALQRARPRLGRDGRRAPRCLGPDAALHECRGVRRIDRGSVLAGLRCPGGPRPPHRLPCRGVAPLAGALGRRGRPLRVHGPPAGAIHERSPALVG